MVRAVSPSMPPSLYFLPSSLTPLTFRDFPFSVMVTSCSEKKFSRFCLASARLAQVVARTAQHHVAAVLDEQADKFNQPHLFRLPAGDGQQDHAERFLHLCVLVEVVEDELRFLAALELDHDAHAFAVALVAHIGDAVDFLRLRQ